MLLPVFRTTPAVRAATHIVGRLLGVWLAVLWLAMPVLGLPCCTDCCGQKPDQPGHCCSKTVASRQVGTCCGTTCSEQESVPSCPCRGTSGCTCGVLKAPAPATLAEAHSGQMQQVGPEQLAETGLVPPRPESRSVPAGTSAPCPAHPAGLHVVLCRYLC